MVTTILYSNAKLNWETGKFDTRYLCNNYYCFELIEEETIDIDNIEEIDMITEKDDNLLRNIVDNQNLILKWAKQADKEIKSIKEKQANAR